MSSWRVQYNEPWHEIELEAEGLDLAYDAAVHHPERPEGSHVHYVGPLPRSDERECD